MDSKRNRYKPDGLKSKEHYCDSLDWNIISKAAFFNI